MTYNETVQAARVAELDYLFSCVANAECCAVVGLSNMGKSALLRSVSPAALAGQSRVRASDHLLIYIDLNLMVDMTEQAFYELILRAVRTALSCSNESPQVCQSIEDAYRQVIDSSNPFLIPLGFNEGMIALCEGLNKRVVLLLDEFDQPFTHLDSRVFLNLRALKDRYDKHLVYVVATDRPLPQVRSGSEIGEFCELFVHQTLWLGPLDRANAMQAARQFLADDDVVPTSKDLDFVWEQAGGHPGLIQAVCHVLSASGGGSADVDYALVRDKLDSDPTVRVECVKLWNGLEQDEQDVLLDFVSQAHSAPFAIGSSAGKRLAPLLQNGILTQVQGQIKTICALFTGFVRRQRLVRSPYPLGVRLDADSGKVWVDGRQTPTLTELEYRLLLMLYGRIGKICDKYQIVETVWGEDYIDQVDDARIEKLVSRLRRKIEPDPSHPHYLQTVRGRGYRLIEP
jgi:hypothetical protein